MNVHEITCLIHHVTSAAKCEGSDVTIEIRGNNALDETIEIRAYPRPELPRGRGAFQPLP